MTTAVFNKVRQALEDNRFQVSCFATGVEAAAYLAEQLHGETIGFGGSMTSVQLGLYEELAKDNTVLWHWKNVADRDRCAEFTAYISSVNAVAESGELVNYDGIGNRVAATLFGPQQVFFVCGVNKLCPDLASAIERARHIAAPLNNRRLQFDTPCRESGECCDCDSPECGCNALVVYLHPMRLTKRTEVILIDEELGL